MVAGLINDPVAFASADGATKPSEASDNASANSFFMLFPLSSKKIGRTHPMRFTPAGEFDQPSVKTVDNYFFAKYGTDKEPEQQEWRSRRDSNTV